MELWTLSKWDRWVRFLVGVQALTGAPMIYARVPAVAEALIVLSAMQLGTAAIGVRPLIWLRENQPAVRRLLYAIRKPWRLLFD